MKLNTSLFCFGLYRMYYTLDFRKIIRGFCSFHAKMQ